MTARHPVRRKITAREAAERMGLSERQVRRLAAEPRSAYLERAAERRERAVELRIAGLTYRQIAAELDCSLSSVSRMLDRAAGDGRDVEPPHTTA